MALTKVSGGILDPGISVAGVVTATGFSGPFIGGGGINAGVVTATSLDLNGNGDISGNLVIGGNLTANGDFTTLNTTLREVELLRVDADSTATAGIITQRGTGNIFELYDTSGGSSVNRVTVVDGGNFGIGTTNPQGKLHISSGTSGDCQLIIQSDTDNNNETDNPRILLRQDGNQDLNSIGLNFSNNAVTDNNSLYLASSGSQSGIIFLTGTSDGYTNATESVRITSDGTVGIGSATPLSAMALDVVGSIRYSNQLRGAGGSASTPSYAFYGDHDTGMYRGAGINILSFATAGTERFKLDADGVATFLGATGIHTGVKVEQTALNYNAGLEINATNGGQSRLLLKTSKSGTNRAARIDFYNQNAQKWTLINDFDQNGTNDLSIRYGIDGGSWGEYLTMNPGAQVELFHGGTKKFETQADGCHIYGTYGLQIYGGLSGTNSDARLSLYPTGSSVYSWFKGFKSDGSRSAGLTIYDGANCYLDTATNGSNYYRAYGTGDHYFQNDGNHTLRILDSGFVGIGSGTPSTLLDVNSGSAATIQLKNTGTVNYMTLYIGASANSIYSRGANSSTARDFTFMQGSSEVLRINAAGNLTFKNTSSQGNSFTHSFRVNDTSGNSQYQLGMVSTGNEDLYLIQSRNANLRLHVNGSTRWKIDPSGHLLPETAGAVDIGNSSTGIGNVYLAEQKVLNLEPGGAFKLYRGAGGGGATNFVKSTFGSISVEAASGIILKVNNTHDAVAAYANDRVDIHHANNIKLTTTTTGISVTGEVAASQDYPTTRPTLDFNFAAEKKLDPRITFYRTTIGSYIDENGDYRWASANQPKFNHDEVTHESKGLLIEPARTNKITSGNNIPSGGNSGGTPGPSLVANDVEAPDGSFTARTVDYSNASSNMNSANIEFSWDNSPAGKTYSASIWVKGTQGHTINMYLDASGQGSGNLNEAKIHRTLTGKWQRMSVYYTYPSGANAAFLRVGTRSLHGLTQGTATVVSFWGTTVVEESRPGSTIATPIVSVTTAPDYALIDGEDFTEFFNQVEGTIISSTDSLDPAAVQYPLVIEGDNTNNERHILAEAGAYQYQIRDGGSTVAQIDAGAVSIPKNIIAAAYKLNDTAVTINGSDPVADTSATMPTCTKLKLGHWSTTNYFGHISRFMYYRNRIPNSQLKTLTS